MVKRDKSSVYRQILFRRHGIVEVSFGAYGDSPAQSLESKSARNSAEIVAVRPKLRCDRIDQAVAFC
jgi:hypothetical protein